MSGFPEKVLRLYLLHAYCRALSWREPQLSPQSMEYKAYGRIDMICPITRTQGALAESHSPQTAAIKALHHTAHVSSQNETYRVTSSKLQGMGWPRIRFLAP